MKGQLVLVVGSQGTQDKALYCRRVPARPGRALWEPHKPRSFFRERMLRTLKITGRRRGPAPTTRQRAHQRHPDQRQNLAGSRQSAPHLMTVLVRTPDEEPKLKSFCLYLPYRGTGRATVAGVRGLNAN